MAILDAFEQEGVNQFYDNFADFNDLYRMIDGKVTFQEMSEIAPHVKDIERLLDGVGIDTWIRHYDIIGVIVKTLVGFYQSREAKFHITDTGEPAENEVMREMNNQIQALLKKVIETTVAIRAAEQGFGEDNQQFESPEEQQQFIAQQEQMLEEMIPKDTKEASEDTYKTIGQKWANLELEKGRLYKNFKTKDRVNLTDKIISGRCFRHYRIGFDEFDSEVWSPKSTFFSRELNASEVHKCEYAGRIDFQTPAQVIRRYGHKIDTAIQRELLGGNKDWKDFVSPLGYSSTVQNSMENNFHKVTKVPFEGYQNYRFLQSIEDQTGLPMAIQDIEASNGEIVTRDRFLPRMAGQASGRFSVMARTLRDDFRQRLDLCQVTEVYFRAWDRHGFLTFEDPETGRVIIEEVTEDILPEIKKKYNIKSTEKESLEEIIESFEVGTLKWVLRPVIYQGVKVSSPNLTRDLYVQCEPMEHQIKGDSQFDVYLPISGYIGKSVAKEIYPWQVKYSFCINQIYSLLEKEIGMFWLLDLQSIPSEFQGQGDAVDALSNMRNIAKSFGMVPKATSPDGNGPQGIHNEFSTYNLSNGAQISSRVELATWIQNEAYSRIGINPTIMQAPTKHVTAEGVKQSTEASFAQIQEIYDEFEDFKKSDLELYLSVAQYCQTNRKDNSIMFTKGDGTRAFLEISDPEFPLRNIGLIPAYDAIKRKELEQYKALLFQNNTIGTDTIELARLISTNSMTEAIDIALDAYKRSEEAQRVQYERQQSLIQQQTEMMRVQAQEDYDRKEASKERDRETKLEAEAIKAAGRAADKDANAESFSQIHKLKDQALKENGLNKQYELKEREVSAKEKKAQAEMDIRMAELKLKAKELSDRIKTRTDKNSTDRYVATVNKNRYDFL